jgi:hypothetical protein
MIPYSDEEMSADPLDDWPHLNPDEHSMLERYAGRKLTDREAHLILRDAKIEGAFNRWLEELTDNPRRIIR